MVQGDTDMEDIYIVMCGTEVDSAFRDEHAACNRILELAMFKFEDVLYDELGLAYSETTSISKCDLI